jgi:methionine-S-sulfoxide reductase
MATKERAVLAGGCFWGMQDLIRKLPGVIKTRVGYTGGDVPNATYRNHGTHAEGIEIIFDPSKVSYRRILEYFFQIHDPTTKDRQGNDIGSSYRSAIYYVDAEQERIAEDTIADVNASGLWPIRSLRRWVLQATFGRLSPSIRITWSAIQPAIPATIRVPIGCCPSERGRIAANPTEKFVHARPNSGPLRVLSL